MSTPAHTIYASLYPDALPFRDLSPEEARQFRNWARQWNDENPDSLPSTLWHPVIRDEIARLRGQE